MQLAPKLAPPPTGLPDIFAAYPVKNFDEAFLPDGSVRGHYAALLEGFGALSSAKFRRRRGLARSS